MNTTDHLVADIERLREHLGIERWLVFGGSWGLTLALAYAERHPERVTEMVIAAVTMTRRSEIQWLYHGVGRFFPAEWARFQAGVPTGDRDGDLVDAYARLLAHPDDVIREQAARDWCDWEAAVVRGTPVAAPIPASPTPASGWLSRASSPTTSGTVRGWLRASCCAMRIDLWASRPC